MNDRIIEEAMAWHDAQQGDACDWDGFAVWLEADPLHRAAYDDIALLDADLNRHRPALATILSANNTPLVAERRRLPLWASVATGLTAVAAAILLALPLLHGPAAVPVEYRTGAGQRQEIALADGSNVTLGPSSRLTIGGEHQDMMNVEGSAYFDIRHNPARTLTVQAGEQRIMDIGTKFDVLAVRNVVRVAVSDGQVAVASDDRDKPIAVSAGKQLVVNSAARKAEIGAILRDDVGSWREGRLVYNNALLSLVAADISRYAGKRIEAAPEIAERRFSGVLAIGDGSHLVEDLREVMALAVRVEGDHVLLGARTP